jgi:predicted N-acetyltransferase YhbS
MVRERSGDAMEWTRGEYALSTDPARLDLDAVYGFLAGSYWGQGIERRTIERSIAHSIAYGVYHLTAPRERQVAFGRVITDRATFAYLSDIFVLESHRGRGLGAWMVEAMCGHPDLQGLRRWVLVTRDAHRLYSRFGWAPMRDPERWMERLPADRYARDRPPTEGGEEG